ncbi:hypothetical protein SAMN05443287_12032 [Micromonospora phaseoli]|uniref:Uncharacterized protein n=1 Tax=Micromonospora phaseoli TaxID=1144548 RepID=A0A1H7DXR7_9ACTN|nr:hypothetical protein CLV64_1216 [Micromonospora phaseoli]SEK06174.1 hypothetical protein SAMN05443287_12032 [Micromonospora phaseoli]
MRRSRCLALSASEALPVDTAGGTGNDASAAAR